MKPLPKRLIEVDLPIRRISDHARREKSIRHGHISTLHIWWARRPLAACRAVLCAALWPDPVDERCPRAFQIIAAERMWRWAREERARISAGSAGTFDVVRQHTSAFALTQHPTTLRAALLDFIADFANWDNSTVPAFLDTARALTAAAHYGLSADAGNAGFVEPMDEREWSEKLSTLNAQLSTAAKPLVVDPFAGGGSIPLEALRIGADAFASDLNPVAVLLNKVVLEYLPRHGARLAEAVREWGAWVKAEAEKELARFYPRGDDGSTPIAYLWARTIRCEGPGCGAEVPLVRSLWLAKKASRSVALQLLPRPEHQRCDFRILVKTPGGWVAQDDRKTNVASPGFDGTVRRGSATCPCCGYTTPVARVRVQLKERRGGADDARLMCIASTRAGEGGRFYRLPTDTDLAAVSAGREELEKRKAAHKGAFSIVPNEPLDIRGIRHTWGMIYGLETWDTLFSSRQNLALSAISKFVHDVAGRVGSDPEFGCAVATCLALNVSKLADLATSLCPWEPVAECPRHLFSRQAVPFTWDFAEGVPSGESSGSWSILTDRMAGILEAIGSDWRSASPQQASATRHPLPDDSADALVTDPPYYDAVPYSYLSDFFYVWLRRNLSGIHPELFSRDAVPKDEEIVVDRMHELSNSTHDIAFYERELQRAFGEGRRVVHPQGIGTIVFASKSTASWEAILRAVVEAGWVITGSWPIDTEMETRVSAQGQARLASSVHLVVRPREAADGTVRTDEVGDWRDVLAELPRRLHEWMPRLAEEGVVGADAIFACLGPALEIFSRYSRVEKASGDAVPLREYLEQVWAAVAREALSLVFSGASVEGFEPDARLTAMWLWTLSAGKDEEGVMKEDGDDEDEDDEGSKSGGKNPPKGFTLEFDAARKIAQGLGAHLEDLKSLVEIKGDQARLLPVSERTAYLFGKDQAAAPEPAKRKKAKQQLDLFAELTEPGVAEQAWEEKTVTKRGETILDRVHQAMILFATGRGEALRRFLVDDGVGQEAGFWKLAQALSALYPTGTSEKRWVDGVLARKKGLGL
ncbi:MAG: DUF1156 domain-containing protein [Chthoniobacterales bacterium]|nr:DUF1156 domain-containing protein [Chthoniobacterales bacterium]